MRVMTLSLIALAVSAGYVQSVEADPFVSDQADAKGFVEDAGFDVLLRNYYFNRNGKSGADDQRDWSQAAMANFSSGFTPGTVGFGVDAYGWYGLKLDGGAGHSGTGNIPVDSSDSPEDEFSTAGGAQGAHFQD